MVGEAEACCKPLCTWDAVKSVTTLLKVNAKKSRAGVGCLQMFCVFPSKCQGHLVHLNRWGKAERAFLRQAAWSRSIATEKHLATPYILRCQGPSVGAGHRAGLCLHEAASPMGLTLRVHCCPKQSVPGGICRSSYFTLSLLPGN